MVEEQQKEFVDLMGFETSLEVESSSEHWAFEIVAEIVVEIVVMEIVAEIVEEIVGEIVEVAVEIAVVEEVVVEAEQTLVKNSKQRKEIK